jgi:hypothetical protein
MTRMYPLAVLAIAGLLGACSSSPERSTYYAKDSVSVGVAAVAPAQATVAGGLNTATPSDRLVVGEPTPPAAIGVSSPTLEPAPIPPTGTPH